MKTKFFLALLIALTLALSAAPAWAQGRGRGGAMCAGGNTTVESGEIVDSLALFGCNGIVKSGATVSGDAVVFGGNLTVEKDARVNRNVAIFGGNATIGGQVQGDVAILGGAVSLEPTAVVDGSLHVLGGGYSKADGAIVRGGISQENNFRFSPSFGRVFLQPFTGFNGVPGSINGVDLVGFGLLRGLITALALAALGALLVVFFPQPTQRVMAAAQGSFGPSLGVGCLTLLVAPMLFLLLLITIVGPVILVIALAAAWIFGWIAVGYLAGQKILEALKVREILPVLAVIVGLLLLAIVGEVPCLGGLVSLLIGTLGVGAVVLTRFGTRPYPFAPAMATVGPMLPMPPPAQPQVPVPTQPSPPPPAPSAGGETQS